jgi:hypothetical protein
VIDRCFFPEKMGFSSEESSLKLKQQKKTGKQLGFFIPPKSSHTIEAYDWIQKS